MPSTYQSIRQKLFTTIQIPRQCMVEVECIEAEVEVEAEAEVEAEGGPFRR